MYPTPPEHRNHSQLAILHSLLQFLILFCETQFSRHCVKVPNMISLHRVEKKIHHTFVVGRELVCARLSVCGHLTDQCISLQMHLTHLQTEKERETKPCCLQQSHRHFKSTHDQERPAHISIQDGLLVLKNMSSERRTAGPGLG